MLGSQRRVHQVRSTIPELVARFPVLDAPLGIEIGAETPEEIAVSILARLVAFRRLGPG
jgi:xanthine/CO dehydrogenase XdhC/CoxF family maturation factor